MAVAVLASGISGMWKTIRVWVTVSSGQAAGNRDILYFKGLTCTVTVGRTATAVALLVNGADARSRRLANPFNPAEKPQLKYGDLPTDFLGEIPICWPPNRTG
jgi:hypothetical protein